MSPAKPTEESIRRRAHEIWQRRGSNPGTPVDDWLQAERELSAEPRRVPPAPKAVAAPPQGVPAPAPLKPLAVAPVADAGKPATGKRSRRKRK
jgi:hypothetical protein